MIFMFKNNISRVSAANECDIREIKYVQYGLYECLIHVSCISPQKQGHKCRPTDTNLSTSEEYSNFLVG